MESCRIARPADDERPTGSLKAVRQQGNAIGGLIRKMAIEQNDVGWMSARLKASRTRFVSKRGFDAERSQ